ncbi:unnamed protein product [Closterium sp. NIES-53]
MVPSGSLSRLHLPSFSTNLVSTAALQDAMVTTTTPGGQRVSIGTCTRTGHHLAMFTRRPGSSLLSFGTTALVTPPCHAFVVCTPASLSLVFPGLFLPSRPCLPRPAFLASRGGSAPLLTPPRFPPTTAPLQTLHMDVCGPARVSGHGGERYFLLVVDDYTRYTTVFPLRSNGEVPNVLIPWIRAVRLQLCEWFREGLPVLHLHSDRVVMEVARTSMIHAAAPHFLWPFAVRYAAHQLNLWPRVSLPETSPTLHWTGKVGDASVFRVWGSGAFVRDSSADKLFTRAIPCVFLGFPPDAPGCQFYHPTSRRVLPSQDVTFDESVPFYRLFPYRTAPLPPPPIFLAPGPPPVDPLPPQGPAPSGVSHLDPLPRTVPVMVTVGSGAARGAASGGAASGSAASRGAEPEGAELGGDESLGAEPGGVDHAGAEPEGAEPGGAEFEGAESGGAKPRGSASSGGPAVASPRVSPRPEPLSPQQLLEWFAQRTRLRSGAAGAGDSAIGGTGAGGAEATILGCAGGPARAGGTAGAGAAGPGGARTRGIGAAGAGGVGGVGAGRAGAGDPGAGGAGAGGNGAGGSGAAVDPGARGAGAGGAASGGTGAGGTVQRRLFFVPPPQSSLPPPDLVLCQVLSLPSSTGLPPSLLSPPPRQSQPPLQQDSPLSAPSPYAEQTESFTERCEPASRPASPVRAVRTGRRVPRPGPPPVPGTHVMALRPSSVPLRFPLLPPLESSLPAILDPESDLARDDCPTVSRLLATVVTDPSFESTAASALVAELVDFAAACHLDYATSLVAES